MVVKDWQWRRYTVMSGKEIDSHVLRNFFGLVTEYLSLHGGMRDYCPHAESLGVSVRYT